MAQNIMVIMGGFSHEKEVSLQSGKNIAAALQRKGYTVTTHDLKDSCKLISALNRHKPDVVFNALHGNWGEDGTIPALLDLLQIPYTHSGVTASCIGMNKYLAKIVAQNAGLKTALSRKMKAREFRNIGPAMARPYVVKPVSDGSSLGVFIVKEQEDIFQIHYDNPETELLIEKYIPGRELTVMCLEGKASIVTEICPKDHFYDYKHKYTAGKTLHILPADLPEEITQTCLSYAETMHSRLGCNTISRSDFRFNPEDGVIFLEINTHPGMTELSIVPEQAKYLGISYEDLCVKLVENASCRKI